MQELPVACLKTVAFADPLGYLAAPVEDSVLGGGSKSVLPLFYFSGRIYEMGQRIFDINNKDLLNFTRESIFKIHSKLIS